MKDGEKQLFKKLCNFNAPEFEEELLDYATPTVLGLLFFNRMQAIAYGTLRNHGLLGKVNREFRNSLRDAYEKNCEKNESLFKAITYLDIILRDCNCKYAMLKGAVLCGSYPDGYRTSNDVDLLLHPRSVSEVGGILRNAGFTQGNIRNGEFQPASRREIIESQMMRGETVPYIKEVNLPGMRYLEVDINFSLDYKNGETEILEQMLSRVCRRPLVDFEVQTLDACDFFIHLCLHLYKEATTLPWIRMKRDMTLYKYCDIYMLLSDLSPLETMTLVTRAKSLGVEKICSFAIMQTANLFDLKNEAAVSLAKDILSDDPDFLHRVISPQEGKQFIYKNRNIAERFFTENRNEILTEVTL